MPRLFLVVLVLVLAVTPAAAHDPGLSALDLTIAADAVHAHLTFARREIELLPPGDEILAVSVAGVPVASRGVATEVDASDATHVRLVFPRPPGDALAVRSTAIGRLTLGHRQYAVIRDERGAVLAERILDAGTPGIEVTLGRRSRVGAFRDFLALGVEHIAAGYDHVLFLVALRFAARGFWALARLITAFTLAHSITLALATLDLVRAPASVVEPLIAASIMYVGVENLLGHNPRRRWLLTFGFGLVHGLGFATALQDLGVGARGDVAVPLLAFNLGVELAQLGIVLAVLPLVKLAERRPRLAPAVARTCSAMVIVAGTYWLLERTVLP